MNYIFLDPLTLEVGPNRFAAVRYQFFSETNDRIYLIFCIVNVKGTDMGVTSTG